MSKDIPPWYHGGITAEEATKILTRLGEPNAFLLRDSQNIEGAYTLTVTRHVESARFVDVENYRILKNRSNNSLHLKTGKKNFPSMKELEKCIQEQNAERLEGAPCLITPVDKTMIEEWDRTDVNWRDKFKVEKRKHDEKNKVSSKGKDSKKYSKKFSRFRLRKKKELSSKVTEEKNPNVLLQGNNDRYVDVISEESQTLPTSSHSNIYEKVTAEENRTQSTSSSDKEIVEGLEANVEVNDGIYTVNTDRNQINSLPSEQFRPSEQAVDDDYIYDNEWNSDTLTKQTTVMDNEAGANDEENDDDPPLKSVNDIYTCQHEGGINIRENVLPKSGSVTKVDADSAIYCMSKVQTTTDDSGEPLSAETDVDSSFNQEDLINCGIYTCAKQERSDSRE